MSLTQHAVPNDKFELPAFTGNNPAFSFPCSECKWSHRHPGDEPCRTCGQNANCVKPATKNLSDILIPIMDMHAMAELITDLACELNVEVPSKQDGVDYFRAQLIGATTDNKRRLMVAETYRRAKIEFERV